MAQPLAPTSPLTACELGAWRGEGVRMSQVLEALAGLRTAERRTATRTSVVTLVIVATDDGSASRACEAMHDIGARHPGRSIVLRCGDEADEPRLDAEVLLHGSEAQGHALWSEEVRLAVQGPVVAHLDSLIEPLTLPDLPVAVWFVRAPPAGDDALLRAADALLVDAREAGPAGLGHLADLARRHVVVDLAWVRLRPWRELLGGVFEDPALRPFAAAALRAEVRGKAGPRHLLAGWLAAGLGLGAGSVALHDARHASIRLVCGREDEVLELVVERSPGQRVVRCRAHGPGARTSEEHLPLADRSLPWSLSDALSHLERDPSYGRALEAALEFAA